MADNQDYTELLHDLECRAEMADAKQPKAIFAGDQFDGQPVVVVDETDITLAADQLNTISVSPEFGVLLTGKIVSLGVMPHQISIGGGYWRLDPRHTACIPSTTPTPIPLLIRATPSLIKAKKDIGDQLEANGC